MWARIIEFMLSIWLALSPFIFHYPQEATQLWANDFICASLVAFLALLSFWDLFRHIHLLTLGVAFWLWGIGYQSFPEAPSIAQQNGVVLGILLFMLAMIPSSSDQLPRSWQKFILRKRTLDKK